jgi:hypothetical protein
MVRCTEACLGLAHSQHPRLVLVPVTPRVLASRDLSQMCKYETLTQMQCPIFWNLKQWENDSKSSA